MTTTTQKDAVLELRLTPAGGAGPVVISCQIIGAEFTPAGRADGDTVHTACGGVVKEPGTPQDGGITGEVFKDTGPDGVTRLLLQAQQDGTLFDYVYTENPGTPEVLSFTGQAKIPPFGVPFTPDKYGRHQLALTVVTSTLAPLPA